MGGGRSIAASVAAMSASASANTMICATSVHVMRVSLPWADGRHAAGARWGVSMKGGDDAMPGHQHGDSIKNPKVYEALKASGMSKSRAAAISNAKAKGGGKGKRGGKR